VAAVRHLFAGLAAAAAGLVAATAIKIAWPLLRRPLPQAIAGGAVALACFVAVALLRWPLLATMSALAPLSILLAWPLTPKLPGSGGR
jgi:chromate transporter